MKGERFLEEMEQIDPELVKEAEAYRGDRNRRRKQLAAVLAAAAAVILAVGLGVGLQIRRNNAGEHWETKYVSFDEETRGEDLLVNKPWEEMSLPARYREFSYRNCIYSVRTVAGADRAGEKLADISVEGEHPFTGEVHGTEAEIFRFNAWSEDAAVLIRFSESPEYYTAVNLQYLPKTLGSMLSDINAEEALLVPGYTDYIYYDSANQVHRIAFEYMTKEYLMSFLMKYADAPGEEMMTMAAKDPANQVSYMCCRIGEEEFARPSASLQFTKTGYIWTNLIDRGIAFCVGEEAVKEYEQYLKENLHGYEYIYVSQPDQNPETKVEETEETAYETREMPPAETVEE